MRPKFIVAMALLVLLALSAAVFFKSHPANAPEPISSSPEIATAPPVASNVVTGVLPPLAPAPVVTTPEQRQAAIDAEVDRLQDWSTQNDPASLSNILADLTYPEKEVREAAIEAVKQFGSTNAIPALKADAANDGDSEEQIELLQAADFLSETPISDRSVQLPPTAAQIQAAQLKSQRPPKNKKQTTINAH